MLNNFGGDGDTLAELHFSPAPFRSTGYIEILYQTNVSHTHLALMLTFTHTSQL